MLILEANCLKSKDFTIDLKIRYEKSERGEGGERERGGRERERGRGERKKGERGGIAG